MKVMIVPFLLALISSSVFGQGIEQKITQDTTARKCKLRYPAEAVKKGIHGTVEIKIFFDANCTIKDYKVVKSLGYGCDEAAVECLINVQEKVKRERQKCEDGYEMIYPFTFKLQ
jgi:periplasmic protein TonB